MTRPPVVAPGGVGPSCDCYDRIRKLFRVAADVPYSLMARLPDSPGPRGVMHRLEAGVLLHRQPATADDERGRMVVIFTSSVAMPSLRVVVLEVHGELTFGDGVPVPYHDAWPPSGKVLVVTKPDWQQTSVLDRGGAPDPPGEPVNLKPLHRDPHLVPSPRPADSNIGGGCLVAGVSDATAGQHSPCGRSPGHHRHGCADELVEEVRVSSSAGAAALE